MVDTKYDSRRSRSRTALLLSGATLASLLTAGAAGATGSAGATTVGAGPTAAAGSAAPALNWTPCAKPGGPPTQQCATLTVPVDYRRPHGPTTSLAVSRVLADAPGERRGTLMVVPGGPGGSGVKRLTDKAAALRGQLGGTYDLVALDPRGVGGSSEVTCGVAESDRFLHRVRSWPGPGGDITENVARARRTAEACAANGGAEVRGLSSANQARDMDRLRAALGERKLSTWSTSYGVYVTALYAQIFPHRTDRLVFDSTADPDHRRVARGWLTNQGPAVEERFADFAAWASDPARGADRLGERPEDVRRLVLALAERFDRQPETRTDGIPLDGAALRNSVLGGLFTDAAFPALRTLIAQAADPAATVALPNDLKGALPDRDMAVWVGVICNDVDWPGPDTAAFQRDVTADRARYPLTGGLPANITPCSFWPDEHREKTIRITDDGPSNILMIQNRRDPATPHFGALKMREALGDRARMVTVERGGHGSYLGTGNACGDAAVTTFLKTGERPARDTVCAG
ncbi:alpha/beta hydrolase [Streptomyces sp. NPDC020875]|uniref:alpha/beta hydrolase n=1 Tax=Streptomyces sp. NPDC020875 TaxID=3154898 RepID=UPI0034068B26